MEFAFTLARSAVGGLISPEAVTIADNASCRATLVV